MEPTSGSAPTWSKSEACRPNPPERPTQFAAKIVRRNLDDGLLFHKLYTETLELSSHNIEKARLALVGASEPIGDYGLEGTYQFSRGEDIGLRRTAQRIVFQRAGKVSRLLSTPDRVDGTVSYSILEARIDEFNEAGIALDLYDLKAAVRRLRNDTPKLLRKLHLQCSTSCPCQCKHR